MSELRPQYVNLFQRDTSWRARVFRTRDTAIGLAVLLVGCLSLQGFVAWRLDVAERAVASVSHEFESRNAGLAASGALYRTQSDYRRLQERVQKLEQLIARQDVVLERLGRGAAGNTVGFSQKLEAVARASIDGVWLTKLEFDAMPARYRLVGVAMSADLLPAYLARLGQERRLGMDRLTNLTVDRSAIDPRALAAGAVGFDLLQQDALGGAL